MLPRTFAFRQRAWENLKPPWAEAAEASRPESGTLPRTFECRVLKWALGVPVARHGASVANCQLHSCKHSLQGFWLGQSEATQAEVEEGQQTRDLALRRNSGGTQGRRRFLKTITGQPHFTRRHCSACQLRNSECHPRPRVGDAASQSANSWSPRNLGRGEEQTLARTFPTSCTLCLS